MKVFISWSGERSRAVAEILDVWLKCVLQATRPWLSSRDIDRGALWFNEINDQLKDTSVGIVCLTQENKTRPWILFESGALAKGLSSNRVCTFLIDLKPSDLEDPLAQFNHTTPERLSLWGLVRNLNRALETHSLDERILQQVFDIYWDQFNVQFMEALKKSPPAEKAAPRPEGDLLAEILENTRYLQHRLRRLEGEGPSATAVPTRFDDGESSLLDPSSARRMIRALRAEGRSTEGIIRRLSPRGVPDSFVRSEVERIGNRDLPKSGTTGS